MGLVAAVLPPVSDAERDAALERALAVIGENGITTVIEAAASEEDLATYQRAATAGALTVRVNASLLPKDGAAPAGLVPNDKDPWLRRDAVKIFADGVLEGETAALLEPYASGKTGGLNVPLDQLTALVTELDAKGIQVHVHAIGDAAVREALDAFAAAEQTNGARPRRHHIAHLQLVHPDDYPRFAALGITANFQALWAFPDSYIVDVNLAQVGQARVDRMYPIASLHRAGARFVLGSDWPVSSITPVQAIEVAVTRQDPGGERQGVLGNGEAIDLATALAAYTANGAWLTGRDTELGTLEAGKLADMAILDRDPFSVPPSAIGDTKVLATYVSGKQVWPKR
jgi:predicted amidohydrolase YtcJ